MTIIGTWPRRLLLGAAAAVVVIIALALRSGEDEADTVAVVPSSTVANGEVVDEAGEQDVAANDSASLRERLDAAGGVDALILGEASGAFEVVSFDPDDPNQLLAAVRDGQGDADNSDTTELWTLNEGVVSQGLWDPDSPHDFAHHNADGSLTRWTLAGPGVGFPLRSFSVELPGGAIVEGSAPKQLARSVTTAGKVFTIVHAGQPEFYSRLVVDDGSQVVDLADAAELTWVDAPTPEVVVAYSKAPGVTRVWSASTLEELDGHWLAGREAVRIAVSADGETAVAIGFDGMARVFTMDGPTGVEFGPIDAGTVDRPVTVSSSGDLAVSIDQGGTVALWSLVDGGEVLALAGDAGPSRLLTDQISSRVTSVSSFDATRVVLRNPARPGVGVTWSIIDLDPANWAEE